MGGSRRPRPRRASTSRSPTSRSWAATASKLGETLPDPGGPTLQIRMISIMGGSDVKRGRKLSRAERKALEAPRARALRALERARDEQRGDRPDREPLGRARGEVAAAERGRRAAASAARTAGAPCSAACRRRARPASARPSRQPAAISCGAVPQLPAPAPERHPPRRQRIQAVSELEAVDGRHVPPTLATPRPGGTLPVRKPWFACYRIRRDRCAPTFRCFL